MPDQYKRPYLDSSVFIAWIMGEVIDRVDRQAIADHVLRCAERGDFAIVISAMTLAEVRSHKGWDPLTNQQLTTILKFFEHPFFIVVDVTRSIAEAANELGLKHKLKPADAIHLACAIRAKCDVLLAWDSDLWAGVDNPAIRVERPQILAGHLTRRLP